MVPALPDEYGGDSVGDRCVHRSSAFEDQYARYASFALHMLSFGSVLASTIATVCLSPQLEERWATKSSQLAPNVVHIVWGQLKANAKNQVRLIFPLALSSWQRSLACF